MQHTTELIQVAPNTLHHCSSIVVIHDMGRMIAAYLGPECEDAQHVFITVIEKPELLIKLPEKTGNPLIWYDDCCGRYFIIYSKFEDRDDKGNKPQNPVQRWMYCSTWFAEIDVVNFKLINNKQVPEAFGLLARCAPTKVGNRFLIPLYREKDPRCEIWSYQSGHDPELKCVSVFSDLDKEAIRDFTISKLGRGIAIQPTLIKVQDGLLAFCRNVCSDAETAWMYTSKDDGLTWSKTNPTKIPNHNNSLIAIPWENDYMLMFNLDRYRSEMILGNRHNPGGLKLGTSLGGMQRQSYSYPNYFIDEQKNLHLIHSNSGMLAVHKMDKDFVDTAMFGNNAYRLKKSKIR